MSASSPHSLMTINGPARAHVNHGRWIALCPRNECTGAEGLEPRQTTFHCSNCQALTPVEWPADPDGIWETLERRPVPSTQNWYPEGHEFAVRAGVEHGQTVDDLIAENKEHGVD